MILRVEFFFLPLNALRSRWWHGTGSTFQIKWNEHIFHSILFFKYAHWFEFESERFFFSLYILYFVHFCFVYGRICIYLPFVFAVFCVTKQSSIELKWIDFNLVESEKCVLRIVVWCRPWYDTIEHRQWYASIQFSRPWICIASHTLTHVSYHHTYYNTNRYRNETENRVAEILPIQSNTCSQKSREKKNLHNVFQFTRDDITDTHNHTASNDRTVHQMWQISSLLPIIFPFLFVWHSVLNACRDLETIAFSIHLIVVAYIWFGPTHNFVSFFLFLI